jgi:hypothetical protein
MNKPNQRVVVLGASNKADKYSNKAFRLLREQGHDAVPVNRGIEEIEGVAVLKDISEVTGHVDTLTMYVNASVSSAASEAIIKLKPDRVIFNPGSNNAALQEQLTTAEIPWESACTLVLLKSGQF